MENKDTSHLVLYREVVLLCISHYRTVKMKVSLIERVSFFKKNWSPYLVEIKGLAWDSPLSFIYRSPREDGVALPTQYIHHHQEFLHCKFNF